MRTAPATPLVPMHSRRPQAFTLIEMLIVIGIIGILAAVGLPAMKGIGQANITAAASRQVLDDLAYARLRALSDRSPVYMVFVPTNVVSVLSDPGLRPEDRRVISNLAGGRYRSYALVSERTVGDQPGVRTARYLTDWKSLPDGVLFPPAKFIVNRSADEAVKYGAVLPVTRGLPFPRSKSPRLSDLTAAGTAVRLPYIGFNAQGQVIGSNEGLNRDALLPIVRGSILQGRDAAGNPLPQSFDIQIIPPRLQTNDFQVVRVNWLTGRAKVEGPDFSDSK